MNTIFILTLITAFLTILIESMSLILQLRGKKLSKWLGKNAFTVHAIIVGTMWVITFTLLGFLQFEDHPTFHQNDILQFLGLIFLITGLILALWGFKLLGLKRSLCLNFFENNVPTIQSSLYNYIKNPEDVGLWATLIGLALLTDSLLNLLIAFEFIILMIPHQRLENRQLFAE